MHFGIMEGLVTWLPPSVDVVAKTSNVKTNKKQEGVKTAFC